MEFACDNGLINNENDDPFTNQLLPSDEEDRDKIH